MTIRHDAPIPDPAVSAKLGRAQRESVPRTVHADLADRPAGFDPVQTLIDQGQGRLQNLLPVRYGRMAADRFSFLRGAAAVMAADIGNGPSSQLTVQLCGDAHLSNFGVFRSPERRLVFDINDFDETNPGPFEWDVKRLAASVAVAAESLSLTAGQQERAVLAAVAQYRATMREFAAMKDLDVWYTHLDIESNLGALGKVFSDEAMRRTKVMMAKAKTKDSQKAYDKLVEIVDGRPRIKADPPLVVPIADLALPPESGGPDSVYDFLVRVLTGYAETLPYDRQQLLTHFTPIDAARKVVGVGSVGTRCFVVLTLGRDGDDPFFLQVKEATTSVLEPYVGASVFSTPGQRVVAGQQITQATPDPFLGWFSEPTPPDNEIKHFYVRQLYDGKASANVASFDFDLLKDYVMICGWTLARAHARSGDRIAIASYLGKTDTFDRAIASFALAYRDRNRRDHQALVDAIASGRLTAEKA